LIIYHQAVPQVFERLTKDFTSIYPEIKVEYRRQLTPVTHMQAIENEKANKLDGADISQYANAIWYRDKAQENFFLRPVGPATADFPKESLLYGAVPVVAVMPFVMAYNTNLVKTPITSMRDLLRPELRGRVGSSDLVAETVYAFYEWIEKTQGADFLAAVRRTKTQADRGCAAAVPEHRLRRAGGRRLRDPCRGQFADRPRRAHEGVSAQSRICQPRRAGRLGALAASQCRAGVSGLH